MMRIKKGEIPAMIFSKLNCHRQIHTLPVFLRMKRLGNRGNKSKYNKPLHGSLYALELLINL